MLGLIAFAVGAAVVLATLAVIVYFSFVGGLSTAFSLAAGIISAGFVYLAVISGQKYRDDKSEHNPEGGSSGGKVKKLSRTDAEQAEHFPDGISEAHGRPTAFLLALYIFLAFWTVAYVVYDVLNGVSH